MLRSGVGCCANCALNEGFYEEGQQVEFFDTGAVPQAIAEEDSTEKNPVKAADYKPSHAGWGI